MRRRSDTLQPGDPAPDFALEDTGGRTHTLRGFLEGGASLLLVFDRGTW
jgi:peroxiredoxin